MLFSYLFYILSLFICIFFAYYADKYNSKLMRNLLICFLVFITGFRGYEVGIDTNNYVEMWDSMIIGAPVYCEVGFQWLILFLQHFSLNPTILFVTCSIITFGLLVIRLWDFRKIASFTVMVAVLYMLVALPSMNVMRQFCAVSIVFFSTRYLFQRHYLKFFLGILIASFLHLSALLGILFVGFELLEWKRFSILKKTIFSILILVGLFISGLAYEFVNSEYGHYFDSENVQPGLLTIALFVFIIFAFAVSNLNGKKVGNELSEVKISHFLILVSFISYVAAVLLQSLGYYFKYMDRIGILFSIWGIVFWGILFKLTKRISLTAFFFVAMLVLVGWPFITILIGNTLQVLPYSFCCW